MNYLVSSILYAVNDPASLSNCISTTVAHIVCQSSSMMLSLCASFLNTTHYAACCVLYCISTLSCEVSCGIISRYSAPAGLRLDLHLNLQVLRRDMLPKQFLFEINF